MLRFSTMQVCHSSIEEEITPKIRHIFSHDSTTSSSLLLNFLSEIYQNWKCVSLPRGFNSQMHYVLIVKGYALLGKYQYKISLPKDSHQHHEILWIQVGEKLANIKASGVIPLVREKESKSEEVLHSMLLKKISKIIFLSFDQKMIL